MISSPDIVTDIGCDVLEVLNRNLSILLLASNFVLNSTIHLSHCRRTLRTHESVIIDSITLSTILFPLGMTAWPRGSYSALDEVLFSLSTYQLQSKSQEQILGSERRTAIRLFCESTSQATAWSGQPTRETMVKVYSAPRYRGEFASSHV